MLNVLKVNSAFYCLQQLLIQVENLVQLLENVLCLKLIFEYLEENYPKKMLWEKFCL